MAEQTLPGLFLGEDFRSGAPYPLPLERHVLTIAGAGAGKGACLILPNLMEHWKGSALVVDPKGEAAELSANLRGERFFQDVAVCDPFLYAARTKIDALWFRGVNLLGRVRTADDAHMIADGIVMRTGRESETHWNDSAADIIAGLVAFIVLFEGFAAEDRHLGMLRTILRRLQTRDEKLLDAMEGLADLPDREELGALAADAAARLRKETNETSSILSTVQTQTRWLTSGRMDDWMARGTDDDAVDLRDLKWGKLSLYLVLPPDKLESQGRFLRLFVRAALSAMTEKDGDAQRGTPCLFILDEFYSLGRMGELQKAAAQMRSYGLHLAPFLQDWGQLVELYGEHGAMTFIANADAVMMFGLADPPSLELAARLFGRLTPKEIETRAETLAQQIEKKDGLRGLLSRTPDGPVLPQDRRLGVRLDLLKALIGAPRKPADEIQEEIAKPDGASVAQAMFVFKRDAEILKLRPKPYFDP